MAASSSLLHSLKKSRRKLLILLVSFLLLLALIATVTTLSSRRSSSVSTSHVILHTSCGATRYPSLCLSAISSSPSLLSSISSHRDVILASLNLTASAVHRSVLHVHSLSSAYANLTDRERTALADCLDMFHVSLDELRRTANDLRVLPVAAKDHARPLPADPEILVSAAMTNQESCLDGFSHDQLDRRLRGSLIAELTHVMHMCSNALGMIKGLPGRGGVQRRKTTGFGVDKEGWPKWMGEEDRRRMAAEEVAADAVVAADGTGDYSTVGEAVAAAPSKSKKRYVIRIKAGTYAENVEVPKKKTNIMFVGDGRETTVITGSRNVVDGSTTFRSATLAVVGEGFLARGLRIENTAGPSKHQAVALRVGADLSAFYDCDILGYQDTLYLHSLRQFFRGCLIQGTVDFIFGNAAAVLQDCDIQVRRPNPNQKNMVTASGRDDPNEPTGIVIHRSRITAAPDLAPVQGSFRTYLGRPWKEYARTVIMESEISDVIEPEGWHEWSGTFALDTLYYGEYRNTGAGAGTGSRVQWKGYKVITSAAEAAEFTPGSFIAGSSWLEATGFPYSLGLSS
ncbi:pectinesterase [Musa acuminata AAA Group]|uniref:pectinesterase n=1 Tax=Musa acuminata AAA Group TaxID=214697 RepID=UPI0031D06111